ncbi:MAG: TIGR02450 family Trp-rich protein [Gammaproteobacteria bacterium]|nr:TIGR02450 family Trp-rich protein [Gammaproteobacteria bacterium]
MVIRNLQNSKWTAVKPVDRAKHFELKSLERSGPKKDQIVCVMRCVVSQTAHRILLEELKDNKKWRKGW